MISFESVTNSSFASASFDVPEGASCRISASSREDKDMLLYTLLGMNRPDAGRVALMGRDVYSLTDKELSGMYAVTGVVWRGGGLVSNLRVWENIMLPLWYHLGRKHLDVEARVVDILTRLGMEPGSLAGFMDARPSGVRPYERTLAGLVRVMLMEPSLVVYDTVFDGLTPDMAARLADVADTFHRARPGRTSIYLGAGDGSVEYARVTMDIRQSGRGFKVWA